MRAPYRKARATLTSAQVADLVARRDAGATWKDVGRAYGLQDESAKAIYGRAVAQRSLDVENSATGGHMDAAVLGE